MLAQQTKRAVILRCTAQWTSDKQNAENKKRKRDGLHAVCGNLVTNAGFVIFQDRKDDIFFTDLCETPSQLYLPGETEEAKELVPDMQPVYLWMVEENLNRTTVEVPGIVAAYNNFMNSVDRMDQLRAGPPTKRREKRVNMSLITWIIDISVNNGFALYNELMKSEPTIERLTLDRVKLSVIDAFVLKGRNVPQQAKQLPQSVCISSSATGHCLLKSTIETRKRCFVCMAMGKKVKAIQFCV